MLLGERNELSPNARTRFTAKLVKPARKTIDDGSSRLLAGEALIGKIEDKRQLGGPLAQFVEVRGKPGCRIVLPDQIVLVVVHVHTSHHAGLRPPIHGQAIQE